MLPLVRRLRARPGGAADVLWGLAALDPGHDAGQYVVVGVFLHSVLDAPKGVHAQIVCTRSECAVAHTADAEVAVEGVEGGGRQGHGLRQPVVVQGADL